MNAARLILATIGLIVPATLRPLVTADGHHRRGRAWFFA